MDAGLGVATMDEEMSGWRDTTCAGCGRRLAIRAEWPEDVKAYCTTCWPGDLPLSPPTDGEAGR